MRHTFDKSKTVSEKQNLTITFSFLALIELFPTIVVFRASVLALLVECPRGLFTSYNLLLLFG